MGRRVALSSEGTNKYVTEMLQLRIQLLVIMQAIFPLSRKNGSPVLLANSDDWDNKGRRPCAGSYVTKLNFEKLMEPVESEKSHRECGRLVFSGDEVCGSTHKWIDNLIRSSSTQRFQFCLDVDGKLLHLRAIQGHFGTQKVDFTLQVELYTPDNFRWAISHGCTPWSSQDWLQEEKVQDKGDKKSALHCRAPYARAFDGGTELRRDKTQNCTIQDQNGECIKTKFSWSICK